jgi:hypothetical protein
MRGYQVKVSITYKPSRLQMQGVVRVGGGRLDAYHNVPMSYHTVEMA